MTEEGRVKRKVDGELEDISRVARKVNGELDTDASIYKKVDGELVDLVQPATPDSEDLHAHYDFSKEDGSVPVPDETDNGYDLDQGAYTGVGVSINGVQAGEFDGTDDTVYLGASSFSDITPATFAMVFEPTSTPDDTDQFVYLADNSDNFGLRKREGAWEWGDVQNNNIAEGGSVNTEPTLLVGTLSSSGVLRVNGSEVASGDTVGSRSLTEYGFASRQPYQNDRNPPVNWGEILVYPDERSSSQISEIESYLSDKWGITI